MWRGKCRNATILRLKQERSSKYLTQNRGLCAEYALAFAPDISQFLNVAIVGDKVLQHMRRTITQASLAGEELLHGSLFEVVLLGDELVKCPNKRAHVTQGLRDSELFFTSWGQRDGDIPQRLE